MTEDQCKHLESVRSAFCTSVADKYAKGAREHGGVLTSMPVKDLINESLNESIDLFVYLYTLKCAAARAQDATGQSDQSLQKAVQKERERALSLHGPLTDDPIRAFGILSEEMGEVVRELLELKRGRIPERACRERAVRELVQVIALAGLMVDNLNVNGDLTL